MGHSLKLKLQIPPLCSAEAIFAANAMLASLNDGHHASLHDGLMADRLACQQA